jgi:hypothetical protein
MGRGDKRRRKAKYGSAASRIALRPNQLELRSINRSDTRSTLRPATPASASSVVHVIYHASVPRAGPSRSSTAPAVYAPIIQGQRKDAVAAAYRKRFTAG